MRQRLRAGSDPEDAAGTYRKRRRGPPHERSQLVTQWGDAGNDVCGGGVGGMYQRGIAPAGDERRDRADAGRAVIAAVTRRLIGKGRAAGGPAMTRCLVGFRLLVMDARRTKLGADHGHRGGARQHAEQGRTGESMERTAHDSSIADGSGIRDQGSGAGIRGRSKGQANDGGRAGTVAVRTGAARRRSVAFEPAR